MASLQELLKQQQMLALQIEDARRSEIAEVLGKIRSQVQQYSLTANDIFPSGGRRRGKALGKVAPKYRDPATGKTWTGRGKAPKWIEGKDRAQFAI
ncbi:MAG: H-NS histone family protein [Burkholderiaceae bacterium]|jgi:DNA-binding protein H-NS|nr:H-NS histone family protein [Burkholderiaceae bacterium]